MIESDTSGELTGALIGGAITALALFAFTVAVGRIGSFRALLLIEAIQPVARFLASAVIAAAMTVLAFLLALVGLGLNSEFSFRPRLYERARSITTLAVVSLVLAVVILLTVGVPIEEVANAQPYYEGFYYVIAAGMAALAGLIVSMALMIGSTLRALTEIGSPERPSRLLDGRASIEEERP